MQTALSDLAAGMAGSRVLITGGLGFIGSNLARVLVEAGAHVTVVDALVSGHGGLQFNLAGMEDEVQVHIGDVRDESLMRQVVSRTDYVFNLSGQTSHLDSMHDPYTDLEQNCRGPIAVLEACRHAAPDAKVVFASTRQVYGRPKYLPVDEGHPLQPVDVNGIHKLAGEAYHLLYRDVYGLHVVVFRLTNTYGPRMRVRDARQTFLGVWIRQLLCGEPLEVWGGTQQRDLNYVDDVLRAFLLAADRRDGDGEVFNLGDERAITLQDLAELLITIHGRGEYRVISFPPERKAIDIGDFYADYAKIRRTLAWEPSVPLEDGLERTLAFFAEHGPRYWHGPE